MSQDRISQLEAQIAHLKKRNRYLEDQLEGCWCRDDEPIEKPWGPSVEELSSGELDKNPPVAIAAAYVKRSGSATSMLVWFSPDGYLDVDPYPGTMSPFEAASNYFDGFWTERGEDNNTPLGHICIIVHDPESGQVFEFSGKVGSVPSQLPPEVRIIGSGL